MKRLLFLLVLTIMLSSCHRTTCPAYMDGAVTGAEGSRDKPQQLFPDKMNKKKN